MKITGKFAAAYWTLLIATGCKDHSGTSEAPVSTQPHQSKQSITPLTEADQRRLVEQRAVIEQLIGDDDSRKKYQTTVAGKLGAIRTVLDGKVFTANQTYQLQCLGIVLGDAFVQDLKMQWVMVEDEYGLDPALQMPGTTIIIFPLTMVSKRVERGENVDIFALYNTAATHVNQMSASGNYKSQ